LNKSKNAPEEKQNTLEKWRQESEARKQAEEVKKIYCYI